MTKEQYSRVVAGVVFGVEILLFSGFLSVIVMIIFVFNPSFDENSESVMNDVQYLRVDLVNNQTSSGIASIHRRLEENEYIYREYHSFTHVLISHFGTDEYQCTGSCFCEENDRRYASSVSSITKGITFLVAAVSSIVAYNEAKKYFSDECKQKLYDTCPSISHVNSDVDTCEKVYSPTEEEEEHSEDFMVDDDEGYTRYYMCKGSCLTSKRLKSSITQNMATEFDCSKLRLEKIVRVKVEENEMKAKLQSDSLTNPTRSAGVTFLVQYLNRFCRVNSSGTLGYWYSYPKGSERRWKKVSLCVSSPKEGTNPTIRCKRIDHGFGQKRNYYNKEGQFGSLY